MAGGTRQDRGNGSAGRGPARCRRAGIAGLCLLLWLLSWFTAFDSSAAAQVVNYLSIVTHFESFAKGVLDSKAVIFYLSMIFFGLFITSRSLESLRWRA